MIVARRQTRGFTLIEVVVAMACAALVISATYVALAQAAEVSGRSHRRALEGLAMLSRMDSKAAGAEQPPAGPTDGGATPDPSPASSQDAHPPAAFTEAP